VVRGSGLRILEYCFPAVHFCLDSLTLGPFLPLSRKTPTITRRGNQTIERVEPTAIGYQAATLAFA
jgi:hypothetical protein